MKFVKAICILCFITLFLAAQDATQDSILFNSGTWEPYTFASEGKGVVTEIVIAACAAAAIKIDLKFLPWERCEYNIQNGIAFATFPYRITEERKQKYYFSDELIQSRGKIFYWEGRGKNIDWQTLKDFGAVRWGGLQGYWYINELKKQEISYVAIETIEQALLMLKSGRIQYFIEDELVCLDAAKRVLSGDLDKLKMVSKPANESSLHLMVSRQYPNSKMLLERFNKGLALIKSNGIYAEILKKYNITH